MNACERQLVNEVLGPLVTEFVPNFGREGATPIQRGSNASLLHRVQAIKLIRHIMRGSDISEAPLSPLVACCAHQVQSGAWQLPAPNSSPHQAGFFLTTTESPSAAVPGLLGSLSQITQSPCVQDYTFIYS